MAEYQLCTMYSSEGSMKRALYPPTPNYYYHQYTPSKVTQPCPAPLRWYQSSPLIWHKIWQFRVPSNRVNSHFSGKIGHSELRTPNFPNRYRRLQPANEESSSPPLMPKQPCFQALFTHSFANQPGWRMRPYRDPQKEGSISALRVGPVILNFCGMWLPLRVLMKTMNPVLRKMFIAHTCLIMCKISGALQTLKVLASEILSTANYSFSYTGAISWGWLTALRCPTGELICSIDL